MAILTLGSCRKKGINAYLVQIHGLKTIPSEMDFGTPATEADKSAAHRSAFHNVAIDLSKKLDGYYQYKEAIGHKSSSAWLSIQSGEVVQSWETAKAFAADRASSIYGPLAELHGTDKQTEWAADIRARTIVLLSYEAIDNWNTDSIAHKTINSMSHAKDWIERCGGDPNAIAQHLLSLWSCLNLEEAVDCG